SACYLSDPLVDCDSHDDEDADQEVGPLRVRADQAQAEREHADDQGAEEHAEDRAAAAEEGYAADHHSGDGFYVGELAGCRRDRAYPSDQGPAGESADEAGKRVDRNQHTPDVDTCEFGGLRIVADGIKMPAPCGAVEHVPEEEDKQDHGDHGIGEHCAADAYVLAEELQ